MLGIILLVASLTIGGIEQGLKNYSLESSLPFLRASTTGLLFLLLSSLLFAANIFVMTFKWKLALIKLVIAYIKSPLETAEVKP